MFFFGFFFRYTFFVRQFRLARPERFTMSRKPSPKAKAFAQAFANALAEQRENDRKNGNGKATYAPPASNLLPIGVAMCDAPVMPEKVFYGTPNDRRVWCETNATELDVTQVCEKVGSRCDNTFRARLQNWQDLGLLPSGFFYTRKRALSSLTESDSTIFVYRCEF